MNSGVVQDILVVAVAFLLSIKKRRKTAAKIQMRPISRGFVDPIGTPTLSEMA